VKGLRVLLFETPHDPYFNLALEEALFYIKSKRRDANPVLRIWRNYSAVIIGYFQKAEEEVKLDLAENLGIAVVRRFTGGGAVYHDLGNINYAIVIDQRSNDPLNELYGFLIDGILNALRKFGVEPRVENINDIAIGFGKVSGVAASFREGTLFLHGSLLVSTNLDVLTRVLKISEKKLADKKVNSVKYRVRLLEDILGRKITFSEIVEKIIRGYCDLLNLKPYYDMPEKLEIEAAKILYEEKYKKEKWNLGRSPSSDFKRTYTLIDELIIQSLK